MSARRGSRPASRGYRMQRTSEQLLDRRLDLAAGIHHDHPLRGLRHHAEIVGDEDHRVPSLRCKSSTSSRIWAWMVTPSAVVGSSAMSTFDCTRAPWRSWLAGACRRTVDAGTRAPAAPARKCAPCAASRPSSARQTGQGLVQRRTSAICLPMVMTGLSDVIGSWKIMEMSLPRRRSIASSLSARRSTPPSSTLPRQSGRRVRHEPHQRERGDGLAAAGFADDGQGLPGIDAEAHPVDRFEDAASRVEDGAQTLHREQRSDARLAGGFSAQRRRGHVCRLRHAGARAGHRRRRGSKMSRSASPNKFVPNTARLMASPGKITSQGAVRTYSAADSESIRPHDG